MNASATAIAKVEAYPVPEIARLSTLPSHFGMHMLTVEGRIYDLMGAFCSSYDGGMWKFFELSNGGFYMSPPEETYVVHVEGNGYRGSMSADAAGITVCLFAFSLMSFEYTNEVFATHYHLLRDFAMGHLEARAIFAAID
jgi:Antirestriction protein